MVSSRHQCPNSCPVHRWHLFFLSSILSFFVGIGLVLLSRFLPYISKLWRRRPRRGCGWRKDNMMVEQCNLLTVSPSIGQGVSAGEEEEEEVVAVKRFKLQTVGWMSMVRDWAGATISGQTLSGRILIVTVFLMSMVSLGVFFYHTKRDTTHNCYPIEICVPEGKAASPSQQFDFALNVFFTLHFILRFLASPDKLYFWMEMYTIVDLLTVPPSVLSIYMNHYWLGLRFTRALRLLSLPDVLQYLNILRTTNAIRLCQLITMFLSLILTAAGCIHLAENMGEPYKPEIGQELTYFECVYFMVVTLSTVGYGDIFCKTTASRAFLIIFILFGLAVFANSAPEIADIIGSRKKHGGNYKKEHGRIHIVLCGHITYDSVANFLADFLHKDREDIGANIVILDKREPDLEMQGLLKRHYTRVYFFQGSMMKAKDLQRVALEQAEACLVLANKYSHDPDAEDAANIMRVISVKNYCETIKVIIQLMQYHNKTYLLNIPSWDAQRGDEVLCLAELKLGFLAQSCLCPGFSTLLANLFTMRSFERTKRQPTWLNQYLEGAGMEMYSEFFSPAFDGMSFPEVCWLCFSKLKLLLLAIEVHGAKGSSERHIAINPKSSVKVHHTMQGFFVAQSSEDVKRVYHYCTTCHSRGYRQQRSAAFGKCTCGRLNALRVGHCTLDPVGKGVVATSRATNSPVGDHGAVDMCEIIPNSNTCTNPPNPASSATIDSIDRNSLASPLRQVSSPSSILPSPFTPEKRSSSSSRAKQAQHQYSDVGKFDASGMHHWCPQRTFDEAILGRDHRSWPQFSDHIVVCVFADANSPLIGLCNFLMPLRASSIHFSELKQVVFIGNSQYLRREWKMLMNFPQVFILPATPLKRVNLRAVHVNLCAMCVILSAKQASPMDDPTLVDKEAILCSLNIKAMRFDDVLPRGLPISANSSNVNTWPNKSSVVAAGLFGSGLMSNSSTAIPTGDSKDLGCLLGENVPLLTELLTDSNVQFLDQDDEDDPGTELYMTQPFACGTTFVVSVLDSLMSTTFFNKNALAIIRTLVTGKSSPAMAENQLGCWDTSGVDGESAWQELQQVRDRCRVTQLTVGEGLLSQFNHNHTYGQLFQEALKRCSILCIGLYRCMPSQGASANKNFSSTTPAAPKGVGSPPKPISRRFVITNPPADFQLHPRDRVFCLKPYHLVVHEKRLQQATSTASTVNSNSESLLSPTNSVVRRSHNKSNTPNCA